MNYKRKPLLNLYRAAPALASLLLAVVSAPTFADRGDTSFLAARDAFRNGERVRLARQVEALQGHPLQAWAEYWSLRLKLDDGDASGVPDYLARHANAYLAEKLRADWLRLMGKKADWESFRRELPALVLPDAEINCYAGLASGQTEMVRPLWTSGQDLPQACEATGGSAGGSRRP
jgi:soluble lytic murein transglycosylase